MICELCGKEIESVKELEIAKELKLDWCNKCIMRIDQFGDKTYKMKLYNARNREKLKAYRREYYKKNKEKIFASSYKWAKKNKERVKEYRKNWEKKRNELWKAIMEKMKEENL